MSYIKLSLPEGVVPADGVQITFRAPCACSSVSGVVVEGVTYTLVDAANNNRGGVSNVWASDALVSVLLDMTNKRAFVLNAAINNYNKSHTHAASDIASGSVSIARGGTGATTAAAARTNLGAAPAYDYSTTDLTPGVSKLTTGKLYFVYE